MSDIYTSNSICLELTRTAVALHPKYFPENPYTGKAAMCYDECIIKVHWQSHTLWHLSSAVDDPVQNKPVNGSFIGAAQ